jgi:hypothetical protein
MSTIKSSAENLTLNADGANNDIIFQSNGSNVATLDQAGTLTATTFTGASTDATKLPLAGGTMTGALQINSTLTTGASDTGYDVKFHGATAGCKFFWDESADHLRVEGKTDGSNIFTVTDNNADILSVTSAGLIINNDSGDRDFRVESDGNANALFVDGGDSAVLFGIASKTETVSTNAAMYFAPTGSSNEYATLYIVHNSAQKHGIVMRDMNNGGTQLDFRLADNTQVGSIYINSSSTTYATSSDYRLKENVDYDFDATTRLKQLKPARFNFISDDTNTLVDGFLAHEVSGIVPEAIIGTKDGMTTEILYVEGDELPEGKSIGDVKEASVIAPQGIDQAKFVPLLVKTIQELEARITALEA